MTDKQLEKVVDSKSLDADDCQAQTIVSEILKNIKTNGDKAINYYETKFSQNNLKNYLVDKKEIENVKISLADQKAIQYAYKNIYEFTKLQLPKDLKLNNKDKTLMKKYIPIENVGLYIPGGTAPLVSTSLMVIIPALVAKCKRIVLCTPCNKDNQINPAILYVAKLCKIKEIYKVGGAQAIGLMAYGTQTIKQVNKIFGPGNKFVMEAKKQINGNVNGCTIDMPAGPSEVLIIADTTAIPQFVASDMLAQLEHDICAKAVLITNNKKLVGAVEKEIQKQLLTLSRKAIINESLKNAKIIIVDDLEQAFDLANKFAPEHLMLQIKNPNKYLIKISNAGSVFIGNYSSEALGDYVSGTNHVLPTSGNAKSYSGLSVTAYMKEVTFQEITKTGIENMKSSLVQLADIEGLDAHKNSVLIRLKNMKGVSNE
ncbi:MAG: histidinol dehydrogenase [Mycoplasmataceae bacterium]|nr:histidinol dehydrogenase [Mycoplasmataceae bacterium]